MSATPETDAERRRLKRSKSYPPDPVGAEFAERLERQRNELRDALEWAQVELGKTTRPTPVDKALASAKAQA